MGCDIHMMMLVHNTKTDKYSPVTTSASVDGKLMDIDLPRYFRNYEVFGLLCSGVRGGGYDDINLPPRGQFAFNRLSDWAQKQYEKRSAQENWEEKSGDYDPSDQVGGFLYNYYGEDVYYHSQTYLTKDHLNTLILKMENKILKLEVEITKLEAKNPEYESNDYYDLEADKEWMESLKNDKIFIEGMLQTFKDIMYGVEINSCRTEDRFDEWVVLVGFDS